MEPGPNPKNLGYPGYPSTKDLKKVLNTVPRTLSIREQIIVSIKGIVEFCSVLAVNFQFFFQKSYR